MTSEQLPFYIGRYLVTGRLGSGGMGVVYLATDERLNRQVAIKKLIKNPGSQSAPLRIRQEALLLAQLNHSNIVQIYDVVEEKGDLALVMEYVDSSPLNYWQRERNPNLPQKLQLLKQICAGLSRAHSIGIIHRDLKADNILIDNTNTAKISDFGIAKNWREDSDLTQEQHIAGSWGAMSPEQALGKPLDNRSDLFALGVLAYQLLCEQNPFGDHNSLFVIVDRIVHNQHPPAAKLNPELPASLCQLLDRLLNKDPNQRPLNAAAVSAELDAISKKLNAREFTRSATRTLTITAEEFHRQKIRRPSAAGTTLIKFAGITAGLLLTAAALIWLLPQSPSKVDGKYIAVISPQANDHDNRELKLLENNVLSAIKQGLSSRQGLYLVPYAESQNARAQPLRQQAQALNAQLLLKPTISCAYRTCELSLDLIDTGNFSVIASRSSSLALDESLGTRVRTLQQINYLLPQYPEREPGKNPRISAGDYQRYLELFERRLDYLNMADTLRALEKLQATAPLFPPLYELYADLTILHQANTRSTEPFEQLEKFLRKAPQEIADQPELLAAKLQLATSQDDPGRAEALLEQLKQALPDHASYYHLKAHYHQQRGEYDKAISAIDKALAHRTSYSYLVHKALSLSTTGDMRAAKPLLLQAITLSDDTVRAVSLLAGNELDMGNPGETIRLLDNLGHDRLGPMDTYNLCLAHYIKKQYEQANQCFDRVIAQSPADADPLLYQAEIAQQQHEPEKARQLAQQAVALTQDRDDWEGQLMLARAYAELGEAGRAIETLLKIRRQAPDDLYVNYARAQTYMTSGDLLSAKAHIRKTLEQGISPIWYCTERFARICSGDDFADLRAEQPKLCATTTPDSQIAQK
jgi:serine/threonine-protein kinase